MCRKTMLICSLMLLIFVGSKTSTMAQSPKPETASVVDISSLIGDWSGESICVNKEKFPACKDEVVVYHLARTEGKTNGITVSADKIVDKKPQPMGDIDFVYDPEKHTLVSELKTDRFQIRIDLLVTGDILEGTLTSLQDKTTVRHIKVKKNE